MSPPKLLAAAAALLILAADPSGCARGEDFEGAETSWKPAGGDVSYRMVRHQRSTEDPHSGRGCEKIQFVAGYGSFWHFAHTVAPGRVIAELSPSLWIKSDRGGMQVLARLVLPRSAHPRTGKPLTALVGGTSYTSVGQWQRLTVDKLPVRLAEQLRVLRSEFGPSVDAREAYVDQVWLNLYGGTGPTTVWIDDLQMAGLVRPSVASSHVGAPGGRAVAAAYRRNESTTPSGSRRGEVRLDGTILYVGRQAVLPRIVQHQGEPLAQLKQLGFNTVLLPRPANAAILADAAQSGLWLICPPPNREELTEEVIDRAYQPVLAWYLGEDLSAGQLEQTQAWAEQLRRYDPQAGRPLVASPTTHHREYSRIVDILLLGRDQIGTSLDLTDSGKYLARMPALARPGTPIWARIQTDFDPEVVQQWSLLAPSQPLFGLVDEHQIRLQIHAALAAGGRGLVFSSHGPLAGDDPIARLRSLSLQWNLAQLKLLEPWAAAGQFETSASSSDPNLAGVTLQAERVRLLLPTSSTSGDQCAPARAHGELLSFVVPGVPEASSAFDLSPVALRPLRHKRVTGGLRTNLPPYGDSSMTLLTSDAGVTSSFTTELARQRRRSATLVCELALQKIRWFQTVRQTLGHRSGSPWEVDQWLARAERSLAAGQAALSTGNAVAAYEHARIALGQLGLAQRTLWSESIASWPSVVASPCGVNVGTLPIHWKLAQKLQNSRRGTNQLPTGIAEDLPEMLATGWKHFRHADDGVQSDVELSPTLAHTGRFSLRLRTWSQADDGQMPPIASPPVWVATPPIPVQRGQLYRLAGWVRIPKSIDGSVDGLMIIDSLGGRDLADRIHETDGWKEFALYRTAPTDGTVSILFALSGLGEAYLDDVTVEPIVSSSVLAAPTQDETRPGP